MAEEQLNVKQKIHLIDESRIAIKGAIEAKGVEPTGNITTYAAAISRIDTANNTTLSVTPSATAQTFTPTAPYTGYNRVEVDPVNSSIDSNIQAGNIKSGVSILGVSGNVVPLVGETKSVSLTNSTSQTFTPSTGNGLTSITVSPTNRAFSGSIAPTTSAQTFNIPSGNSGNGSFTVGAVSSNIDSNIQAGNIKSGVSILGVTGNYSGTAINNQDIEVYTNGIYTAESPYTGLGSVKVAVNTVNNTPLTVVPSTSSQTLNAPSPYTGYGTVTVNAVSSNIDANIVAGNIKQGVSILGVAGSVVPLNGETRSETLTSSSGNTFTPTSGKNGITSITVAPNNKAFTGSITPTTSAQTFTIPSGYSGNGAFTVGAVTSAIDSNIQAGNIKQGVTILGVEGTLSGANMTSLSVTPSTSSQSFTPTGAYNGFDSVTVGAVTSAIDSDIISANIKSGVSILGVTGSLAPVNNTNLSVTPSTSDQSFTASSPYTGYGTVSVGKVTSAIDNNITAGNIKSGVSILGVTGSYTGDNTGGLNIKMTSNGTLGGDYFAVSGDTDLWKMFDGNINTSYYTTTDFTFTFYSPIGIVLSAVSSHSGSGYVIEGDSFVLKGSNNGTSWTTLSYSGSLRDDGTITVSTSTSYKYFKFENFHTGWRNIYEVYLKGTYDSSNVNTFVGITREIDSWGGFGFPKSSFTFSLPSNATDLTKYALRYAFDSCTTLTAVSLSSLTSISGQMALDHAFYSCTNLASANFSSLTSISGSYAFQYAFYGCSSLASIDFSSLNSIGQNVFASAFYGCTSLTSLTFPMLNSVGSAALSNAFISCTSLASVSFPALTSTSFGSYTNQFQYMLQGVTGCTVHFPSNLQSVIGSWSDVVSGFGGTNTVVLFDLPATESSGGGYATSGG